VVGQTQAEEVGVRGELRCDFIYKSRSGFSAKIFGIKQFSRKGSIGQSNDATMLLYVKKGDIQNVPLVEIMEEHKYSRFTDHLRSAFSSQC
jgi:hypothetical protein